MEQEKNISMEEEKLNQPEQLEQSDQPEQEVSNQGLLTDAYTGVTPIIASEDQREAVQGEEGIRIQYGFYADEIKTALKGARIGYSHTFIYLCQRFHIIRPCISN